MNKKHPQSHREHLPKVRTRTLVMIGCAVAAAVAVLFVVGFWVRHERIKKREAIAREERDKPLVVEVVEPKKTQKSIELTLPADIRAYAQTALYARTDGYLAYWKADIGDRVRKGDVIAILSAPDTDADLAQAVAALRQQQTNYQLSIVTDERYRGLVATQGVTQQQLDQTHSSREQASANVAAASASVDRLKALVGFERIVAPFDGVVTARTYDIGALISATNISPGQELFDLAEDDRLRVYVNVPQSYSLLVLVNQPVALSLERNYPGHRFAGIVARSAGTLDPVTRTLRTELDFRNDDPSRHLFPGMYAEAIFTLQREQPVLTIPTSALLFEADGKQVAVVDKDDKVHFQKIVPGSDFGTEIEIVSGLSGDERIVANPGEQLSEGIKVEPTTSGKEQGGGAPPASGSK